MRDAETGYARGSGGRLAHGIDRLSGEPRKVRPALQNRIGAAD
jgi:hypothetical protein